MAIKIVAEIGINHNGNMETCKELIDVAASAGADAVKFQKRDVDLVYTQEFLDEPRESPWGNTQRDQKNGLEFGLSGYQEIDSYCRTKEIDWFASACDINSQKFLRQFDTKYNNHLFTMMVIHQLRGRRAYSSTGTILQNEC